MFDALIVGAGPAGATAARLLARAGWQVALVEKANFPRRKVCGEFISAATVPVLQACGVGEDFLAMAGPPVTRVGIYAGDTMLVSPSGQVLGRALGREHLDTLLRDAAIQAGARLYQPAELTTLDRTASGFTALLEGGTPIAARIVIAACGSWATKGALAIAAAPAAPSDLFAFKAHFRAAALPPGLMPLLAFPGGYGGMVQTDDGRVSLSCCIRRDTLAQVRARHGGRAAEAVLAHIRATTRGAARALDGAVLEGAFLSAGPIRPGIRTRYRDGIFFTGNIAGEAHPVIAEGISMAIQSSGLLAQHLAAGSGAAYARAWRRRFAVRIHAASLFAHLAMHDTTRRASLAMVESFPPLLDWGARISGKPAISV